MSDILYVSIVLFLDDQWTFPLNRRFLNFLIISLRSEETRWTWVCILDPKITQRAHLLDPLLRTGKVDPFHRGGAGLGRQKGKEIRWARMFYTFSLSLYQYWSVIDLCIILEAFHNLLWGDFCEVRMISVWVCSAVASLTRKGSTCTPCRSVVLMSLCGPEPCLWGGRNNAI